MELLLIAALVAAGYYFFTSDPKNGWKPVLNPTPVAPADLDSLTKAATGGPGKITVRFGITHDAAPGQSAPTYALATGIVDDVKLADMPDGSKAHLWKVVYQSAVAVPGYGSDYKTTPLPAVGAEFILQDNNIGLPAA